MRIQNLTADFFQGEPLPQGTDLVGWSALVTRSALPRRFATFLRFAKACSRSKRSDGIWNIYDKRYRPESTLEGHLTFAMRHETIDLLVLKRILQAVPETALVEMILAKPIGVTTRRIWFFFETLPESVSTSQTRLRPQPSTLSPRPLLYGREADFTTTPRP